MNSRLREGSPLKERLDLDTPTGSTSHSQAHREYTIIPSVTGTPSAGGGVVAPLPRQLQSQPAAGHCSAAVESASSVTRCPHERSRAAHRWTSTDTGRPRTLVHTIPSLLLTSSLSVSCWSRGGVPCGPTRAALLLSRALLQLPLRR